MIYIVTLPNGFFGSAGASWRTLSISKISSKLIENGYPVKEIPINKILDMDLTSDDIVFYTSSDDSDIRAYVKDVIFIVSKFCHVFPSMDALMAHENKGFQQLYRKKFDFGGLEGTYFFNKSGFPEDYPYVYKTATGAGSSGVELIKDPGDLKKVKRNFRLGIRRLILMLLRRIQLTPREFDIYKYRYSGKCLSVSQEFIPDLSHDYKVLIFGDKFFVLERRVAKNSFKASGSGRFRFPQPEEVPSGLLDYAESIHRNLGSPFSSLDVALAENEFKLIEYQCTNFGPYTLVNSKGFYFCDGTRWAYKEGKSDLEICFAEALLLCVESINDEKH